MTNNKPTRCTSSAAVSLKHDGTDGSDGTGIQSVSPVPSASAAGPSVPSVSNGRCYCGGKYRRIYRSEMTFAAVKTATLILTIAAVFTAELSAQY